MQKSTKWKFTRSQTMTEAFAQANITTVSRPLNKWVAKHVGINRAFFSRVMK